MRTNTINTKLSVTNHGKFTKAPCVDGVMIWTINILVVSLGTLISRLYV